jgi:uncharacterized protein
MKLAIAKDLSLPVDVVTQTIAVLAKRRAGKSYTMRRLVEQLLQAEQQVVLVDPKGDQWGIRSAADGKGPGFPVVILGGERADVPLEANAGEIVAKLVVEERVSVLLDLSLFRKHEVATFMTGFLESLYRLKAREVYRTPMMLVVDEADAVAPQKPQKGEERMLGAAEDIVRRGGQRGIGCVLVTQRSAVLNKNVLTQAQVLIALRTIAPQDLDAMKAWIDVHGTLEQQRTLMESLPSLPVGDAWVWSPGWPTTKGIFKRVHVLPIETFDSGATPDPGQKKRAEPKRVAEVDLEALKRQMSATIEKAKADDPRELRKQVAELRAQLSRGQQSVAKEQPKVAPKTVERFVLKDGQLDRLVKVHERMFAESTKYQEAMAALWEKHAEVSRAILKVLQVVTVTPPVTPATVHIMPQRPRAVAPAPATSRPARPGPPSSSNGDLGGPELKILTALAELEALGLHPADKQQLGLMAGYTNVRSGGFSEPLGRLMGGGYVASPRTGQVAITDQGRGAVGEVNAPQSTEELQARILEKLTGPEQKLLGVLLVHYPESITKEQLAAECVPPYTNIRSGGFSEPLGRLSSLGLVESPQRGSVVASSSLFLAAGRP